MFSGSGGCGPAPRLAALRPPAGALVGPSGRWPSGPVARPVPPPSVRRRGLLRCARPRRPLRAALRPLALVGGGLRPRPPGFAPPPGGVAPPLPRGRSGGLGLSPPGLARRPAPRAPPRPVPWPACGRAAPGAGPRWGVGLGLAPCVPGGPPSAPLRPPPPPPGPSRGPPALRPLRGPGGPLRGSALRAARAPPAGRGWRPCGPPFPPRPARRARPHQGRLSRAGQHLVVRAQPHVDFNGLHALPPCLSNPISHWGPGAGL